MLTETATTSYKLPSTQRKDECIGPPTSSKKDFSVVTSLVTTERGQASFFC